MDQNISKPLCVSPEKKGVKTISHLRVLVVSPMFGGNPHQISMYRVNKIP